MAYLTMNVDPKGGINPGYELKMNSYDLGVDIELADAVRRIRFEHPEVGAVVIGSDLDRMFCPGANIGMLASASHALKVNFCKFTNETRNEIEDATRNSSLAFLTALAGNAAGGGYELALATDHIILIDDRNASVSFPEVPLLGVLPGTGGLARLTDKRHVRRDRADVFCTLEEGVKGEKALEWGLIDELAPTSSFENAVAARAKSIAAASDRPFHATGVKLLPLERQIEEDKIVYSHVQAEFDRSGRAATITLMGPASEPPSSADLAVAEGAGFWPLVVSRELDDAILHLRVNEPELGTLLLKAEGDLNRVLAHDKFLRTHEDWFVREVRLLWARVLRRIDLTSRTIMTLIEPGSCFGGFLADLALAADRSYMLIGSWSDREGEPAQIEFTDSNREGFPMSNGISRMATRFWGDPDGLERATAVVGKRLDATEAMSVELVTDVMDDLDWSDELRLVIEERSSFSPDALTAMEANLRFPGPETMETKIFGRLTAWQNWVFQRPNASGEAGALRRYGSGIRPEYDTRRV